MTTECFIFWHQTPRRACCRISLLSNTLTNQSKFKQLNLTVITYTFNKINWNWENSENEGQFENNNPLICGIFSEDFLSSPCDLLYDFPVNDIITKWVANIRSSQERRQHTVGSELLKSIIWHKPHRFNITHRGCMIALIYSIFVFPSLEKNGLSVALL